MFWKRLYSFFLPSPGAIVISWIALILFILLCMLIFLLGFSDIEFATLLAIISLTVFPITAIIVIFAVVFYEKRPGGRVLLWGLITGFSFAGITLSQLSNSLISGDPEGSFIISGFIGYPILIILIIFWLVSINRAWPHFKQALKAARLQRLFLLINARGEVSLNEFADECEMDENNAETLILEQILNQELMAYYDHKYRCVSSAANMHEKQQKMVSILETQGKTNLKELSESLHIESNQLRKWIYSLAQRGLFYGFSDWAEGWVYYQEVDAPWKDENRCPHCGGHLDIAGKGIIVCEHCRVEVFL